MVKKEDSFQQSLNGIRSSSSSSSSSTTANSTPTTSINYLLNNSNFKTNSKENINHPNYNLLSGLPINTAQLLLPTTSTPNTINNSSNYTEMQNLATMANVANQLVAAAAAGNPILCATNPNDVTQVYFQNANELAYKIPANAVHFMNAAAAHQHMNGANSNANKDNARERDLHHNKNNEISSKLNGSSSSNSSNAGESVIEETVKKREMRLMKNRYSILIIEKPSTDCLR